MQTKREKTKKKWIVSSYTPSIFYRRTISTIISFLKCNLCDAAKIFFFLFTQFRVAIPIIYLETSTWGWHSDKGWAGYRLRFKIVFYSFLHDFINYFDIFRNHKNTHNLFSVVKRPLIWVKTFRIHRGGK